MGELGSGKSSLLMAIMGGMSVIKADSNCSVQSAGPSRAYVAQEPMIMNATVKDNVLFGIRAENNEELEERYSKAIARTCDKKIVTILSEILDNILYINNK